MCVYVRSAAHGVPGHGEGAAWGVAEEGGGPAQGWQVNYMDIRTRIRRLRGAAAGESGRAGRAGVF